MIMEVTGSKCQWHYCCSLHGICSDEQQFVQVGCTSEFGSFYIKADASPTLQIIKQLDAQTMSLIHHFQRWINNVIARVLPMTSAKWWQLDQNCSSDRVICDGGANFIAPSAKDKENLLTNITTCKFTHNDLETSVLSAEESLPHSFASRPNTSSSRRRSASCFNPPSHRFKCFSLKMWIFFLLFQEVAFSPVIALRSSEFCKQIRGLTPRQRELCQQRPTAIIHVSEGTQLGMSECKWQFRDNRWNCTIEGNKTLFGTELRLATKEKAFDYAIKSAGVLYAIVTACGKGLLSSDCGCAHKSGYYRPRRTTKRGSPSQIVQRDRLKAFRWGGCSVDIAHGLNYSRDFMDAREIRQNERSLMNLHNYEAGRLAIALNLKTACRCHGVSGSCTMRTCWVTMPSFREVGNKLKRSYRYAERVEAIRGGPRRIPQFLKLRNMNRDDYTKPDKEDLVFIHDSPTFCERDDRLGSLGTHGRQCNVTDTGSKNCTSMCCDRGYRTVKYVKKESCNCKFFWCCTVQCEWCYRNAKNHTCN